jgi:hypothetical protein
MYVDITGSINILTALFQREAIIAELRRVDVDTINIRLQLDAAIKQQLMTIVSVHIGCVSGLDFSDTESAGTEEKSVKSRRGK